MEDEQGSKVPFAHDFLSSVYGRALFEDSPIGLLLIDRSANILAVNRRAGELFDAESSPLSGHSVSELVHLKKNHAVDVLLEGLATGVPVQPVILEYAKKHLRAAVSPVQTDKQASGGSIITLTDITEYIDLDRRYQHAQKMETVGRLTGGLAHDFNNLLTSIMAYIELGKQKLEHSLPPTSELKAIEGIVDRASRLTSQLLSFGRKQVAKPKQLNLNHVLKEMQLIIKRTLSDNVELYFAPGQEIWPIQADPTQLGQILLNLVINARDAMPDGGQLIISTRNEDLRTQASRIDQHLPPGEYVVLVVKDNGFGMDEEVSMRIFEPFYTTKDEGKGTGLGLSTVQAIMTQMRGRILVDSKVGEGTVFSLYFPRCMEETEETQVAEVHDTADVLGGSESILIVDDDKDISNTLRIGLSIYGYTVMAMNDPHLALSYALVEEHKIDLAIIDVVMPTLGGDDLVQRMKTSRPNLKTLFISGHREDQLREAGQLREGDPFLHKPFSPAQLAKQVRLLLEG
ncbi:response regulator [bacterium]|nr:response regulator [bacterium]